MRVIRIRCSLCRWRSAWICCLTCFNVLAFLAVIMSLSNICLNLRVVFRLPIILTSRTCWTSLVREWLIWSRARLQKRSARLSTSRMTLHQRRRRRFGERTSGHLSRRKEAQPVFLIAFCVRHGGMLRFLMFYKQLPCPLSLYDSFNVLIWHMSLLYEFLCVLDYITMPPVICYRCFIIWHLATSSLVPHIFGTCRQVLCDWDVLNITVRI